MSFNGSGTYVPPAGQPVATGTVIQSVVFNTLVTDIGNTFNNVLPRDGQASMSGQLKLIDGTSSVPGIAFNSEASSGIFRPASGMLALVAAGVEGIRINSSGRVLIGSTVDDATNKLQVTGAVKITGALTATSFVGPITGTATNVTGIVAVANGGTGSATAAGAAQALGVVQQGTGVAQGANLVKLGWGSTGGGLKCTIDTTDQGYLPFSTTNTTAGGTITFASPMSVQTFNASGAMTGAGALNIAGTTNLSGSLLSTGGANFSNGLQVTNGTFTSAVPIQAQGGSAAGLTGNGYIQMGATAATNVVMDYSQIQARNNGAASALTLNAAGGLVSVGSGGLTVNGTVSANSINSAGAINAQGASTLKIGLYDTATPRGYVSADAGYCFRTINATNTVYTFSVDNSGNANLPGTLTSGRLMATAGSLISGVYGSGAWADYRYDGALSTNGSSPSAILTVGNINAQLGYVPLGSGIGSFAPNNVTEIGRYLDWHAINSANDYDARMTCTPPTGGNGSSMMYFEAVALTVTGNVTANSDETLKKNWQDVSPDFLVDLSKVKSGIYDRIDMDNTTQMGVSAQSLQKVAPHAVLNSDKGILSVAYGNVALVATVELAKEMLALKSELMALKEAIKQLTGATQ